MKNYWPIILILIIAVALFFVGKRNSFILSK